MTEPVKRIGVVQGAPSATVQALFSTLAERWQPEIRVAGVVAESHGLAGRACSAGYLHRIGSDERFSIFQDIVSGATTCHLDSAGVRAAAASVMQDIAAGCDLVLLSKFGKIEAAGTGLRDVFEAAIAAGIPLLTSVSPTHAGAWDEFAAPLSVVLPADAQAIDAWQRAVLSGEARRGHGQ